MLNWTATKHHYMKNLVEVRRELRGEGVCHVC